MVDRTRDGGDQEALVRQVRRLETLAELHALKAIYFRCVDTRDWAGFRRLFTDDCVFESELMTDVDGPDGFVAMIQALILPGRSAHAGHSPVLVIEDDDNASGTWAMYDRVELDPATGRPGWKGHGRYVERYRRSDGAWRISSWRLDRTILHRLR